MVSDEVMDVRENCLHPEKRKNCSAIEVRRRTPVACPLLVGQNWMEAGVECMSMPCRSISYICTIVPEHGESFLRYVGTIVQLQLSILIG